MTDPKLVEMAREIVRDYQNSKYCGDLWNPWFLIGLIEKALQAYLLQESAPLVGALNYINHLANQEGEQVGYSIKSQRVAQKALLCFQKKHGGVV